MVFRDRIFFFLLSLSHISNCYFFYPFCVLVNNRTICARQLHPNTFISLPTKKSQYFQYAGYPSLVMEAPSSPDTLDTPKSSNSEGHLSPKRDATPSLDEISFSEVEDLRLHLNRIFVSGG